MKKNVGRTDQIVRVVVGLVLLALGILVPMVTWLAIVLIVLGVIALITGIFAICPLYIILKMNTLGK